MKQVISVNVDEFEGDISVKRNINLGGNITAQGNAHIKKNLRVDGYIDCPNFKGPNKGLFNNLDSLKESYPNPIDGWWALVGDTLPAQLFIVVNGEWCDSGVVVGDGLEIDLTDINEMIEKLQDSLANISSPILPFYGIYNTSDGFKIIDTFDGILREMKVVYFIDKKRFYLLSGQNAIEQWSDSWQYMNDNMPRGDRLYVMNNRLYQFDGTSLVLLGSNGISPFDIVQNRGNSKEKAMSQDAVSRELENIESMIDMPLPIFDGVAPSGIELNEKGGVKLDNGSILFSAELGSFVCLVGEKYYASWLDTNGTRKVELYNIFDTENNKSNAVTNKLFICNNKLYFFNGENLIELGSEIPSSAFNQNKSLSIDANGNIKWKSIIPAFYEIITESTPVTEVVLSEYNNSDNIIYFLSNAHFANLSKVFPIFAKKNIYGKYIIPNTYNPNIDEYNYKKGNSISPIQNKIYECITNKQQYYFDGKTLRLLSDNHLKTLTYAELRTLIEHSLLIPGMKYRITDFTTYKTTYHITKIGAEDIPTLSDRHPFDIIVTADSKNSLEAKASAALNENDNYFSHFGCNLEKWELEYEIEPDENILDDDNNYKGTITYMKDEHGNEATYDFKNIMFDVSNVDNLPDYLDTKQYGSNKRRPIYTFSRLIQNVSEINGIYPIYNGYYGDNGNIPDCYVADASLCNEYNVVLYNYNTVNLSFDPVENNVIKLKDEYKALFACTSAYFDGFTLKYGVKTSYYTFDIKHKADHNLIINSYGNAYDSKGATVFIIGSTTSFINVNGMLTDNHCMNLSHSYVCVNENGKQIIDLSNLQQRLNNIDENLQNTFNQFWNLQSEFESFKVTDENNNNALATRITNNEKAISSLGTRTDNAEQSIRNLKAFVPNTENLKSVSYKSFMSLMANGNLIPGTQYLISDFVNYYKYTSYRNYNNFIPIIVTADSSSTINPYARLADGRAIIKIRVIDRGSRIADYFMFEGELCYVSNFDNVVTYNNITYTELHINSVNTGTYYYTYVKKEEWESIYNGYGVNFYVNYYMAQLLPEGSIGAPKGAKFDPEQHYIKYINIGEYEHKYSAGDRFMEIIWMRDSNGNEAPYEFLHNTYDATVTFNGTCKNNIIKIPYYYDSMSPISYIKLTDCNGNNITVTNDKLHITEINSCNNNEILLTSNSKRITLSNIDNSLIVDSEENTHIHKKTLAQELGEDETSAISQKGVKNAIDDVNTTITNLETTVNNNLTRVKNEAIEYTDGSIDTYIDNSYGIILPVLLMNVSTASITTTSELPENPICVYYNITSRMFYAKDDSGIYHRKWNAFTKSVGNKLEYFPSSEAYTKHKTNLLRDLNSNSVWGSLLIACTDCAYYRLTPINENFFDSASIEASETRTINVYKKQNYFISLNDSSLCTISYKGSLLGLNTVSNAYRPNLTSQLIIKTAENPTITFTIPTVIDEVVWENGAPPVFESYMYYVFDLVEMYIVDLNIVQLLITYKSFPYPAPVVEEYIDLGLPSGTLWATKNVGAASPEEYGNYYAWGEIETKEEYLSDNCSTSGIALDDISGNSQYDAATANLDTTWKMPTKLDIEELINNCTLEATTLNSVNGYKIIGPNGNSIFVPSGGYKYSTEGDSYVGASFYCWSSTPDNNYQAYEFKVKSDTMTIESSFREYGFNIRPIKIITEQS